MPLLASFLPHFGPCCLDLWVGSAAKNRQIRPNRTFLVQRNESLHLERAWPSISRLSYEGCRRRGQAPGPSLRLLVGECPFGFPDDWPGSRQRNWLILQWPSAGQSWIGIGGRSLYRTESSPHLSGRDSTWHVNSISPQAPKKRHTPDWVTAYTLSGSHEVSDEP